MVERATGRGARNKGNMGKEEWATSKQKMFYLQ